MKLKTQIFLSVFLAGFATTFLIGIIFLFGFENSIFKLLGRYNKTTSHFATQMIYNNLEDDGIIDEYELLDLSMRFRSVNLGADGYVYVVNLDGILVIHPTSVGRDLSGKLHIQEMIENKTGSIKYSQTTPPNEGREKKIHYRYIKELGWIVAAGPYLDDINKEFSLAKRYLFVAMLVAFIINFVMAFWLAHTIYSPIKRGSEQMHMLVHRINSKKLKKEIHNQITNIADDKTVNKTLNSIKKLTPKKHS